jgi:hypothetical protein
MKEHIPFLSPEFATGIGAFLFLGILVFLYEHYVKPIPYLGPLLEFVIALPVAVLMIGLVVGAPVIAIITIAEGENIFAGMVILFAYIMCANPAYHFFRDKFRNWQRRK